MMNKYAEYRPQDIEAVKILEDFLPDKIFDAHAHLFDTESLPTGHGKGSPRIIADAESYRMAMDKMLCSPRSLKLNIIPFPDRAMSDKSSGLLELSDAFLIKQLETSRGNVGEIMVHPEESAEEIEKRLVHKDIRGLKCYYMLSEKGSPLTDSVDEYLPEGAWHLANEREMYITLHLVRNSSLCDEGNSEYICRMAKAYPKAKLILAHAARAFAAWTGIEGIDKIAKLENVFFDFSSVCESPAMLQIIKKAGIDRCMWGSDYPISVIRGKPVSIARSFAWLTESDNALPYDLPWLVGIENLMAMRELSILADLSRTDVEKLFFANAEMILR